jgi:transcription antitermination factor NusA-like protein
MRTNLDIKSIQYINLFEKITGVKANGFFIYNSVFIFAVPRFMMSKALGENASNINRISMRFNKKVRVVPTPAGTADIERFVRAVIFPYDFKRADYNSATSELEVYSLPRTKAMLIGRDKTRLKELSDILHQFFGVKKVLIK